MWFKFKNVATFIIETFYLLFVTILLGNPFHVKQVDDIFVMAATAKTTLATIVAVSPVALKQLPISATSYQTITTTASSSLANAFYTANNGSERKILKQISTQSHSIEFDTLNDDTNNYKREFLRNKNVTKHIALSNNKSIQLTVNTRTEATVTAATTTKLISPTMNSTELTTEPTTKTTRDLISLSTTSLSLLSSLAPTLEADDGRDDDPMRLHLKKTQLDVLASLSLLSTTSLNDSATAPLTKELKSSTSFTSSFASANASASTSTLTFPIHEATATALRRRGNEQNMHNISSHLTVDNANATIVSAKRLAATKTTATTTSTAATLKQQQESIDETASKVSSQNTSPVAKSNNNGSGSKKSISSTEKLLVTANQNGSRIITGATRISARKVDSKYIPSKAHRTDAPMLNYIFDTFSSANKHHHHDQRYGPHFEDVQLVGQPTNITVQAGSSIFLNCRISLLQDKTVSWVRRNSQGENALDLLTVGLHTYTGDKRYKMEFQYPSNWRLKINNVKKDDEATYECQISTHPPRVIQINLHVNAPKVMIVDEFGDPLQEKYYEQDSTLQLSCVVRNVAMSSSVVFWKHSEDILNYDVTRGGVSVKTELMDDGANSTLFIAKINKADSGNYTCSISEYQNYTIVVHILNGESFAELHHGAAFSWQQLNYQTWLTDLVLATLLLLLIPAYIHR